MSETFGREDKPWHIPSMDGYKCTRTERSGGDKGDGGLCIYTREQINAHHWTPSINGNFKHVENERQWILFDNGRKRLAFLHCYLACQTSRNDDFLEWNEILFELLTTEVTYLKNQGFVILCMGDFNSRVGCLPGLEGNRPDARRLRCCLLLLHSDRNFAISTNNFQSKCVTSYLIIGISPLPCIISETTFCKHLCHKSFLR